jgi:hypothetical protein
VGQGWHSWICPPPVAAPIAPASALHTHPHHLQGPGEPVATAAGVLGVMCFWRAFYTVALDPWSSSAQRITAEAQALREAATVAVALAAVGAAALQVVQAASGVMERGQLM